MSWWEHAACKTRPDLTWFPGARDDPTPPILVCRDCPVRQPCLADADRMELVEEGFGIRGGLTAPERDARRRRQRLQRRRLG